AGLCRAQDGPGTPPPPPSTTSPVRPPPPPPATMAAEPTPPPAPPPSNPNPASTQPTQVDDRLAYGVGFTFGQRIRQHLHDDGKTADTGTILKGVIDGLSGHDPAYLPEELAAAVARIESEERQRQAAQRYATDP